MNLLFKLISQFCEPRQNSRTSSEAGKTENIEPRSVDPHHRPGLYHYTLLCPLLWLYGIAILTVTSPVVINVPTRSLLAVETKDSFVLWLVKSKYQKTCL